MIKKIINKSKCILSCIKCFILYYFFTFISLFLKNKPQYKDLWLIAERKTDARDNGYWFFKYLCENQKHINCAYIIDCNSPDFQKVKSLGRTIQPNSFEHYVAFACSKVKVSSHIMGFAPDTYGYTLVDRDLGIIKGKKIFLQHGIIKDYIPALVYPKVKVDLFVCSTIPEYKSIIDGYSYPDGVVQRLGLCRYDNLLKEHEVKRRILVMPTWRYYLRNLDENSFRESEYYRCFDSLINNETVFDLLEENDYELVFYLHHELQKFTDLFVSHNKRVKILGFKNADVQELLMNSALLVTDFSSVYFDFAYMRKPLVYWTFDRELFFAEQYGKGYFSYSRDGFGPEVRTLEEVLDFLKNEFKNKMTVEEKYAKRTERTFSEFTTDHCRQTYDAILKLLK